MEDVLALTTAVNTLAVAIACRIENDAELALLAGMLVQLGDTLNSIIAQRALQASCRKEPPSPFIAID